MAETVLPTRDDAIAILEVGRDEIESLVERLPQRDLTRRGLGGGSWSPKDLIGHLASWEEIGLDALAAWERSEPAPIDGLWRTLSTTALNSQNVDAKARWSLARVRRESERTHAELLDAIRSMSDERWRAPVSSRGRRPLGLRLGSILGGSRGPFTHDESHVASLRAFLESISEGHGGRVGGRP